MILSQTAIYALKAALHLGTKDQENPVRVDDIASALDVPRNYLSKILHVLARSGVLVSTRGPRGGFALAVPPEELMLSEVIRPFHDIVGESGCLLGREQCSDENPCPAHTRWRGASVALKTFFLETSVSDLSRDPSSPLIG